MPKQSSAKVSRKKADKISNFEPNMVSLAVATLAVAVLVLIAVIVSY